MPEETQDFYEFGELRLEPLRRVLLRAGTPVDLTPKDFDLLLVFVRHPGKDMKHQTLLNLVWGDADIEDQNIAVRVSRLRRALGDTSNGNHYIVTVPKVGYRFVAAVKAGKPSDPNPELESPKDGREVNWDLVSTDYYLMAADNAARAGLRHEAIIHAREGLEVLARLPDTVDKFPKELLLLSAMAVPLMTIDGYASPEVERTLGRIGEICQHLGESAVPLRTLWAMWLFNHVRGRFKRAREISERCLQIAEKAGDANLRIGALNAAGFTASHLGDLKSANFHLTGAAELYDAPSQQSYPKELYLLDPRIACRLQLAVNSCIVGCPDAALEEARDAMHAAQRLGDSETIGLAFVYNGWIHQLRRDRKGTERLSSDALALAARDNLPQIFLWGTMLNSWAVSGKSNEEEVIRRMRSTLEIQLRAGARVSRTYFIGLLCSVLLDAGRFNEAAECAEDGLKEVELTSEQLFESELHRLRGECLHARSVAAGTTAVEAADTCFMKSLHVARAQNARLFELRACMSLVRVHRKVGGRTRAIDWLAEVYEAIKEGRDTADMADARSLLNDNPV